MLSQGEPRDATVTLVLSCTVSELISQMFLHMTPPLFHPNCEVFLLDQIADVGVSQIKTLS